MGKFQSKPSKESLDQEEDIKYFFININSPEQSFNYIIKRKDEDNKKLEDVLKEYKEKIPDFYFIGTYDLFNKNLDTSKSISYYKGLLPFYFSNDPKWCYDNIPDEDEYKVEERDEEFIPNEEQLEVNFKNISGDTLSLNFSSNSNIKLVIQKLKEKLNLNDPSNKISLTFEGKNLYDIKKTLKDYEINSDDTLHYSIRKVKVGPLYKQRFQKNSLFQDNDLGEWNQNASNWRKWKCGLNIEGTCINKECEANKKKVICPIGLSLFDYGLEQDKIVCPLCKNNIDPYKLGLSKCYFKLQGVKIEKNKEIEIKSSVYKMTEGDFEYFSRKKAGVYSWEQVKLICQPINEKEGAQLANYCSICRDVLIDEEVKENKDNNYKTFECGHISHKECLEKLCKSEIFKEEKI
ncbi:MAG: hypothetical protein MJ252_03215 [archaeon]|nr:hypothetical protein [archaeon]